MNNYKNKLGTLADKLRKERPATPIQEVHPVKGSAVQKEAEVQFNNWIPRSLLKKLKAFGLESGQSLKEMNIQALEFYLDAKARLHKNTKNAI